MRDIEHQTTIGIYCSGDGGSDDNEDKQSIIKKLKTIKNEYFGDLNKNYNSLGVKVEGKWINDCYDVKDIIRVNEEFDRFIQFIDEYGEDDEDGCCSYNGEKDGFLEAGKNYMDSEEIDVEDGDLEFENSFTICDLSSDIKKDNGLGFRLLFSTDSWYSTEEESLKDLDLYLSADMNDTEGDYFEFSV